MSFPRSSSRAALSLLCAGLLPACLMAKEASHGSAGSFDTETQSAELVGNSWGEVVALRDDSSSYPNGKPAGGWWVAPIHATLLTSGKVLITGWGRRDRDHCGDHGSRMTGTTFLLDPNTLPNGGTLNVQPLAEAQAPGTSDVLYCSGHTPIADGRVLFTGGARYQNLGDHGSELEFGLEYARVFTPQTSSFARVNTPMLGGLFGLEGKAWYPTNTRLGDGRVLTIGGFARCCDGNYTNRTLQIFDPRAFDENRSPWTLVAPNDAVPWEVGPGLRDYVHTVLLPQSVRVAGLDRSIAMIGASGRIVYANLDANVGTSPRFTYAPGGQRPFGAAGWDTTAALVSTGEIMTMGGTDNNGAAQRIDLYQPATSSWRSLDTGIGRRNASSVLLPDGTVLLVNGGNDERNYAGDRRSAQILDPQTGGITTLAPWPNDNLERGYHNFAILLKDGRVLIGGGISSDGGIGCERADLRLYNPPYFSKGPQPVVNNPPSSIAMQTGGATTRLSYTGDALKALGGVVLLATGSTTHAFDQNQRFVRLAYTRVGNDLTITPPSTTQEAPPGDYLLFLVSQAGVPSSGLPVRIQQGALPATDIRRTVIFIRGQTVSGQDMFIRGGIDHSAMLNLKGVSCENADGSPNYRCAIPVTHRNLRNATTTPWKQGDTLLDWYGPEGGQSGISHGIRAAGTALDWTTNNAGNPYKVAVDGFGFEPLNDVGDHLWMLDVDMDCAKGFADASGTKWFEVKSFIAGPGAPGWEPDVAQAGAPYATRNHVGKCGMINVFSRGSNDARTVPFL